MNQRERELNRSNGLLTSHLRVVRVLGIFNGNCKERAVRLSVRSKSTFRFGLQACLVGTALVLPSPDARADNYRPADPHRGADGAAQDIIARLQPYLERSLGQPIIVENRSGASTMTPTRWPKLRPTATRC
jgi:hypothetical protein